MMQFASPLIHSAPRTPSPNEYLPPLDKDPAYTQQSSLLQELYEPDLESYDILPHHQQQHQQQFQQPIYRRATFPYVRHDREDIHLYPSNQPFLQQHQQQQQQPANYYPEQHFYQQSHSSWSTDPIKHEDLQPQLIVPSQSPYQQQQQQQQHSLLPHQHHHHLPQLPNVSPSLSYLPPHPHSAMPVQHTDDAASKETQYLRRRCFNCHTTEPPSWRRSTLNPGKIVCNKCGLYERTHLRPRPLRFDELRAGNKARKASNASQTQQPSKNPGGVSPKVKKEPREPGLPRRSSVSSSASSTSGASDWDDNVSVYSASSGPPTSFNSPAASSFPLSRDSQSPPLDSNLSSSSIRLPNSPFCDLAAYHHHQPQQLQQYSANGSPLPSPPLSASLPPTPHMLSPSLSLDGHIGASPLLDASSSLIPPMMDGLSSTTASSSGSLPGTPGSTPRKSHSLPTTTPSSSSNTGYYSPQSQHHQQMTLSPQSLALSIPASSPSSESGLRRMSVSSSSLGSVVEEREGEEREGVERRGVSLTEELESGLGLGVVLEESA